MSFEARGTMDYQMKSKPLDENKAPDVEISDISSSDNRSMHSRYSSLSSTVRSSDFEDPFQFDQFEIDSSASKDELLDHTSQQADDECSLQSPQLQTMERFTESFGYRIPYVFSSNKSGTQMDWSVTSTESLFSIHIGSASFTQEQFSWLVKSGEQNDELYKNMGLQDPYFADFHGSEDEVFSIKPGASPLQSNSSFAANTGNESTNNNDEETGFEPGKVDQEMDHNSNPTLCSMDEQARHSVRCSDASGQSFAFPLLVEDEDRGSLEKSGVKHEEKPAQKQPQPTQWSSSSSSKAEKVQTSAPELTQSSSWYSSCFACCSCRS